MKIIHKNLQKIIKFQPHTLQDEIIKDGSRFKILNAGRRFGKSLLGAYLATYEILQPNKRVWVVAPTNALTEKIWREIYVWFTGPLLPFVDKAYTGRGGWKLVLKNGSWVECKSADNPTSLIGEGLDLLIIDEASRIKELAWREALRPTLSDRMGKLVAISTPKGSKNWYYQDYRKGVRNEDGYKAWNMPTNANPHFPKLEWQQLQKEFGVDNPVFKQEFLAEFIDDVGAVFRGIRACIGGDFEIPIPSVKYSIGVDLAKTSDFTVCFVIRHDTRHIVHMDRYNQVPYDEQITRITNLSKRYNNANILVDSTGVGDPVYDLLKNRGANIKPFKFTNPSKENLIRNLVIALENREITYPKIDVLIDELEIYEYTLGATGIMRYSAPDGEHDDCVIALALAVKAVQENNTGLLDFYKGINEKEETKQPFQLFQRFFY